MKFIRDLISRFSKNGKPTPTKLVYTDKAGNKYFTFKEPSNIPATRALTAWVFTKDAEFCLTSERWRTLLDKMTEALNQKQPNIKEIGTLISLAESADELYCERETLLKLASVYVIMNDEDPESYETHWQEAKRKAWGKDTDAESFFLQLSYQYTPQYSAQQSLNVHKYLEEVRPVVEEIYHLTRSKRSGSSS